MHSFVLFICTFLFTTLLLHPFIPVLSIETSDIVTDTLTDIVNDDTTQCILTTPGRLTLIYPTTIQDHWMPLSTLTGTLTCPLSDFLSFSSKQCYGGVHRAVTVIRNVTSKRENVMVVTNGNFLSSMYDNERSS